MGTAAETINMRTDPERKHRLQLAANLSHQSLTAFVLSAADEKAARVLAEQRTTALPAEFFDAFFDAAAAEPTPSLLEAAQRHNQYVRRER